LRNPVSLIGHAATMYRVLKAEKQLSHRSRSAEPRVSKPVQRVATKPRQVWSWDITYLRAPVRGQFFYLYMVMDVWSRKIVGFEVHADESAEHASKVITKAARPSTSASRS
jgi:putative transposase